MSARSLTLALAVVSFAGSAEGAPRKSNARTQCLAAHEDAQSLRTQKKPHAAHDKYVACAKAECPSVVRKECAQQVVDVDKEAPTVAFEARDLQGVDTSSVTVAVDGAVVAERLTGAAVDVEPGEHDFKFESPDGKTLNVHLLVLEGEKNRKVLGDFSTLAPKVGPPPPPPGEPKKAAVPVASFVLGGVAVVALGSWGYFGLTGKSNEHSLNTTCGPHCTDDEIHPVKTSYLAADISLVIAIAAAAGAVILALPAITGAPVKSASAPWMPRVRVLP